MNDIQENRENSVQQTSDAQGYFLRASKLAGMLAAAALFSAAATFAVTALLVNIFERKQEARNPFFRVVEITDDTEDGVKTFRCNMTGIHVPSTW